MWVPVEVAKRKQYALMDLSTWSHAEKILFTQMEEWCKSNVRGNWSSSYTFRRSTYLCNATTHNMYERVGPWFYFSNRNDMLIFKLKWA